MEKPLLLVDAPSLYFRAYFGLPESMTDSEGRPVNAIRGYLDMISLLIRERGPRQVISTMDYDWRPAWRVELIPTYKSHRVVEEVVGVDPDVEEIPDTLSPQVPILIEVLEAFGLPVVGVDGHEADDVIGTFATVSPGPVEIATGDRDLFQLIDDKKPNRVLYCGRGVANLQVCDNAAIEAKYGVPAARYADFAALRGDPSDGLPGVPGVGEKTAATLIRDFGDLDGIIAALDTPASKGMKPGVRAKLIGARDYLAVAPKVVNVVRDLAVPAVPNTFPTVPADEAALTALAKRHNIAGSVTRLREALAHRG